VRAVRESLLNAARHGKPPVSLYLEVGPLGVEAFVRDHGPGFDLDEVPEDRLGVRQSILGRMERHGGGARVRRLEHGTEVVLTLPPASEPAPSHAPSPTLVEPAKALVVPPTPLDSEEAPEVPRTPVESEEAPEVPPTPVLTPKESRDHA
jgi:hypothetical protein